MRRKAIIISSIFVIFALAIAVYALINPDPTIELVLVQHKTFGSEKAYTSQASEENAPPCYPYFVGVSNFINGLAVARKCCRFGVINTQGEIVLPFIYEGFFREDVNINHFGIERALERGFIAARYGGRWGAIDFTGEIIIPFEYDDVSFNNAHGVAIVRNGGVWIMARPREVGIIEIATGREIVSVGNFRRVDIGIESFGGNIASVANQRDLWGVVCLITGDMVIQPRYEQIIRPLRDDKFLLARSTRHWVLYTSQGKAIRIFSEEEIPAAAGAFTTSNCFDVRGDRILINPWERNTLLLDTDGNEIVPPIYSFITFTNWIQHEGTPSGNWAYVSVGTEQGVICIITGEFIIPLRHLENSHLLIYDENTAIIVEHTGFEYRERVFTFINISTNQITERPEGVSY
ncbi:MAG: WG repeat-containing protein [Defluviitaleaceae bacterium]|nr:WG repeat-containing protein [Defluviitaleaceae bacterium]